jgi:hypothetical protein
MRRGKVTLFLSGLFFGGALDYTILTLKGSELTPYGVRAGVKGNWGLAALDGVLAVVFTDCRSLGTHTGI